MFAVPVIVCGMFRLSFFLFPVDFAWQLFLAVRKNIHFGRAYAVAWDPRNLQPGPNIQGGDSLLQQLRGDTGIDQCAEEHVAANAGKTIEIGYVHKSLSLAVRRRSLAMSHWLSVDDAAMIDEIIGQRRTTNDLRPSTNH